MNDKYVIESHELNEGYAKEFTNVMLNGKRLVKNPEAKIINYFVIYPVYILLCIGYSVLCGIFLKKWDNMVFAICLGVGIAAALFVLFRFIFIIKFMKKVIRKDRSVTLTLDLNGIEFDDHINNVIKTVWDSVGYLRSFEHGVYFIPKSMKGILVSAPIEHKQGINDFLRTNNIPLV
jgi:hypothetical protein